MKRSDPSTLKRITRINLILYSLLLVATPFLLLQNYLQDAIGRLSLSKYSIGQLDVPWIPTIGLAFLCVIIILNFAKIRKCWLEAVIVLFCMVTIAQNITDIYFDHHFYELQQNWHYIAYGLFAWFMYRDQKIRSVPPARIILRTFLLAFSYSAFDELFQFFLSNRIFDVSDIAKDTWGCLMGMAVLNLCDPEFRQIFFSNRSIRHRCLSDYTRYPFSLFFHLVLFGFFFLFVSSLLTEHEFILKSLVFTLVIFLSVFCLIHLTTFRFFKRMIYTGLIMLILIFGISVFRNYDKDISLCRQNLIIYKGVPLPFFDVLIYPDGVCRFVDKKKGFTMRDKQYLMKAQPDVILIGTGFSGKGGFGFPSRKLSQFVYNGFTHNVTQVLLMKNPEACRHYNRLKRDGKKVLFVIHQDSI